MLVQFLNNYYNLGAMLLITAIFHSNHAQILYYVLKIEFCQNSEMRAQKILLLHSNSKKNLGTLLRLGKGILSEIRLSKMK